MKNESYELFNIEEVISTEKGVGKNLSRIPNELRRNLNPNAEKAAIFHGKC